MGNQILVLLILIMLNAFFSASEIALISLNDHKIKQMADDGNKKAKAILKLLGEPSRFLATIQIGITLAGFLASAFAAESFSGKAVDLIQKIGLPLSASMAKTIAVILITIILSYMTLVFGELVPKRLAMKRAERISMTVATPLNLLAAFTYPFVKLLTLSTNFIVRLFGIDPYEEEENITEEEIRLMVDVGGEKGTIHETEKIMINNIFEFNDKAVTEIMTHRTDIIAIPIEMDLDDVLKTINAEKYSRIPIYKENIDNIIGVLYVRDMIRWIMADGGRESFKLESIIRPPYFVATSKKIDELLRELQIKRIHMAIIIDEYGGTEGLVTMEDIIEEIFGNIFDEYDIVENEIIQLDEKAFIFNGSVSLNEAEEYLDIDFPEGEFDTISGFIIERLGRIPKEADDISIEFEGFIFKVEEVDEKKITKVRVSWI